VHPPRPDTSSRAHARTDYIRTSDVKPVTGDREPVGRAIAHEDIAKLQLTCLETLSPAGIRDATTNALMH
jgi:hypothetical protein